LADALDSGSSGSDTVGVQVLSSASKKKMTCKCKSFFYFLWDEKQPATDVFVPVLYDIQNT